MAVKKDRAAEPLLSPGAKFIVNIMAEGQERPLMKQLLKTFKPGEDRFAGLDIEVRSWCEQSGYLGHGAIPHSRSDCSESSTCLP